MDCFLSGKEAVQAVRDAATVQLNYAVALVDIRMASGLGGVEAVRQIREIDPNVQIIFVTAFSDYTTDEIFRQISGAVLWFRKPFHPEELYQVVRNSCTSWNQAHQLKLLRRDLASRVELQTERLNARMQSVSILQKNSLKRELRMGAMKRELRSLKAYQDLRLLLRGEQLAEPDPLDPAQEPVELLLVDDSNTVRMIYQQQQLEEVGFRVQIAGSVEEAFMLAQQHTFEVALIDFYMPGGNGDKLIRLLHEDPHTMYVLSLLFTNAGDEMTAVESGAVYWMIKDQPAFLQKMMLVRDYVQKNRSQVAQRIVIDSQFENRRVLLVDDDVVSLHLLSHILGVEFDTTRSEVPQHMGGCLETVEQKGAAKEGGQHPFEVSTAEQGEQAIALVREAQFAEQPFAIALIDMRMPPGVDGLDTARQIRQISPQIDIVILTAHSDYSLEQMRGVLGNNFSFIQKPYSQDVVLQRVIEGCEKWKMVHEVNASHHALLNLAEDMEEENLLRQEAEQRLVKADRAKDQFLASMSHELRTPLTVIIGNCKFLAEKEQDPERSQLIHSIGTAGRNQLALVNDILDMSKIQSGKFTIDEAPYDLGQLVSELEQIFTARAVDVGLDFVVRQNFHEERQLIGDEQRITQIMVNLVGNAIKFTDQGEVSVTVWHDAENLFFKVKDSGIGMSMEAQQRLFKQFEQADSSIANRFGGSGLGLFISDSLAQMMGGTISVESEEGSGSTFQLMLPYRQSELMAGDVDQHSSCQLKRYPLSGFVLVAEDIVELQMLERRMLEQIGVTVAVVDNGEEAVKFATENPVDLILMDMQMPVMNGVEATSLLRQLGFTKPIVALSANVMKEQQETIIEAGCDHFLSKPIDDEALWRVLSYYLGRQQERVKMEPIVWCDTFSVGHAEMDRQRREIADLVNELIAWKQSQASFSREQMMEILPKISVAYAAHMRSEEQLLASIDYPALDRHRQKHEMYLAKLASIFESELDESSACMVVTMVVDWWHNHVLSEDMGYRELVKGAPPACIERERKPKQPMKHHILIDEEMMGVYVESAEKNIEALIALAESQAWDEAQEIAHRIKGTALTFGFSELSEVALQAQLVIGKGELDQAPAIYQKLIEALYAAIQLART